MHRASVLPVTLRSKVTVGLSDTLQQLHGPSDEPMLGVGTFGDTCPSYSRYTLLTSLHRRITPVAVGSSGAEGLDAACLTSSLEHSTLNAPMLNLTSSVQPVLHSFFTWSPEVFRLARMPGRRIFRQPSDAPMLRHRLNRRPCFLPNSSNASQRSI